MEPTTQRNALSVPWRPVCFHLYPFSLFVLVDSFHSVAYKNFTNLFRQPLLCLPSPTAYPKAWHNQSQWGSLFTLFSNNPPVELTCVLVSAWSPIAVWVDTGEHGIDLTLISNIFFYTSYCVFLGFIIVIKSN